MQLPSSDELVLVSGIHPIRAKRARHYEEWQLRARILSPPLLADLVKEPPKAHRDDWSALLPVVVDQNPATDGRSDGDSDNAGIRREPALPAHEAIAPESPTAADPFAILMDEADNEPVQANMLRQRMRTVARQAALDPGDGLKL
jgi:type IV secretion system protein VirD4